MVLVLDRQKSQAWDKATFDLGLPSSILMAMAAQGVYSSLESQDWFSPQREFIILAGSGNNGGDGYVLAFILAGISQNKVKVYYFEKPKTQDCEFYYELCQKNPNMEIFLLSHFSLSHLSENAVVIDAIFGTGFNKTLPMELSELFKKLNEKNLIKVALDIPSGVFADGDFFSHTPFKADLTLSIGSLKVGLLLPPGIYYSGKCLVVHTGFIPYGDKKARLAQKGELPKLRKISGHKYTSGVLHLWGGSKQMEGAAILSGNAFLASGGGLVYYFTTSEMAYAYLNKTPEIMIRFNQNVFDLETELYESLKKQKKPLLAMGMGLREIPSEAFIKNLCSLPGLRLILDASFLNHMALFTEIFQKRDPSVVVVLTPHLKEAERLLGVEITNIRKASLEIAKKFHAYVYLKGPGGILVSFTEEEIYFNSQNYVLATGGTGDILTGLLANFLIREENPLVALEQGILFYLEAAKKFQDKPDFFVASQLVSVFREVYEVL